MQNTTQNPSFTVNMFITLFWEAVNNGVYDLNINTVKNLAHLHLSSGLKSDQFKRLVWGKFLEKLNGNVRAEHPYVHLGGLGGIMNNMVDKHNKVVNVPSATIDNKALVDFLFGVIFLCRKNFTNFPIPNAFVGFSHHNPVKTENWNVLGVTTSVKLVKSPHHSSLQHELNGLYCILYSCYHSWYKNNTIFDKRLSSKTFKEGKTIYDFSRTKFMNDCMDKFFNNLCLPTVQHVDFFAIIHDIFHEIAQRCSPTTSDRVKAFEESWNKSAPQFLSAHFQDLYERRANIGEVNPNARFLKFRSVFSCARENFTYYIWNTYGLLNFMQRTAAFEPLLSFKSEMLESFKLKDDDIDDDFFYNWYDDCFYNNLIFEVAEMQFKMSAFKIKKLAKTWIRDINDESFGNIEFYKTLHAAASI